MINVDFWQAMDWCYKGQKIVDTKWTIIEAKYNRYFQYVNSGKGIKIIPKIIHQIWLGSPLPEKYKKLGETFKQFNPDYEYKLWTDENIKNLELFNIDKFNQAGNMGMKSDILRYEILNQFGGIYADVDFECLKSLDDLLYAEFFCGCFYDEKLKAIPNGLIGSKKGNKILLDLITSIGDINSNNFDLIMENTGPIYFCRVILKHINDIVIFPCSYFYPLSSDYRRELTGISYFEHKDLIKDQIKDYSYTIHYFECSWKKLIKN